MAKIYVKFLQTNSTVITEIKCFVFVSTHLNVSLQQKLTFKPWVTYNFEIYIFN